MGLLSRVENALPGKRVRALIVVIAALVASILIFRHTPAPSASGETPLAVVGERDYFDEKDTDGDGIADWEESLWGLSTVSPDSDGDGVGDVQEIQERQTLLAETPSLIVASQESDEKLTPSALAGRVLLSQFLVSKQAGIPFSEDLVGTAGDLALAGAEEERSYTTYTMDDINVTNASGKDALHEYGNDLGVALTDTSGTSSPHELAVLLSYSQSDDPESLKTKMEPVVARYDKTIEGFLTMDVPSSIANTHLSLVNALSRVRADLEDMANIGADPIVALSALAVYAQDSSLMATLFANIRNVFETNDVTFSPGEPAYAFVTAETAQQ